MREKIFYLAPPVIIIFLVFVFQFFYPIPKDILSYLINFISAGSLIVIYMVFGLQLAEIFRIQDKTNKYIYGFLLSISLIGGLIFIFGFLKTFNFYFFYFLSVVLILISIKELKKFFKDCKYLLIKLNTPIDSNLKEIMFYAIAGFLILYSFFCIITPPVYYDELVYQLGLASQYINNGKIYNIKNNLFSHFPTLMQMNYVYFLIISGDIGVKIFQLTIYIFTLFLVLNLAKVVNASGKWILLLLLSFPLFILNSVRATAELPLTIFILAIFNYILQKDRNYEAKDIILIGILTGAVLSIKYTGFIFYFFILFYFVFFLIKKQLKTRYFIFIIFIPIFMTLPYLVKNYFFTGNPFYPFLSEIFNTGILKEEAQNYIFHLNSFGIDKNLIKFILSPFYIVFKREFFGGDILTPLFIISLFSIFLTFNLRIQWLWIFIFFYYVVWFLTSQVLRFLLPICIILILVIGIILKKYDNKFLKFSFLLLVLSQIFISFYFVERYLGPFELFVHKREKYISQKVSYYNAAQFLNKENKIKKAVLLLGDARVFYYNFKVFTNTVFNKNDFVDIFKKEGEKKFSELLKKNNIGYIVINYSELERLKTAGFIEIYNLINDERFKKFIDNQAKKIYSDNDCVVYFINSLK